MLLPVGAILGIELLLQESGAQCGVPVLGEHLTLSRAGIHAQQERAVARRDGAMGEACRLRGRTHGCAPASLEP